MSSVRGPWRFGASQGNELSFLLSVENSRNGRRRSRLPAQHSLETFFDQLFAHPVDHGCAGCQSINDLVVAPSFAGFRDPPLTRSAPSEAPCRAAPFLDQRRKLFPFALAQPQIASVVRVTTKATQQILANWLTRTTRAFALELAVLFLFRFGFLQGASCLRYSRRNTIRRSPCRKAQAQAAGNYAE
jgi:hypothetical protein